MVAIVSALKINCLSVTKYIRFPPITLYLLKKVGGKIRIYGNYTDYRLRIIDVEKLFETLSELS